MIQYRDSQVAPVVKNPPTNAGDERDVGLILWRRAWQPTPVFLHGESDGQRSLVGYSPQGGKESDTTERLSTLQHDIIQDYFFSSNYSILGYLLELIQPRWLL